MCLFSNKCNWVVYIKIPWLLYEALFEEPEYPFNGTLDKSSIVTLGVLLIALCSSPFLLLPRFFPNFRHVATFFADFPNWSLQHELHSNCLLIFCVPELNELRLVLFREWHEIL